MGLGKTFIVLAFLKWHYNLPDYDGKPYLIVAPVSLLENWENEYNKFFQPSPPRVMRLYGPSLSAVLEGDRMTSGRRLVEALQGSKLCLTTYETMRRQQMAMAAVDWAAVVVDEAQKIKTPGTLVTNAAKALKADFKIAMTGTPVENTLVDLWCIMDFVVPGILVSAKDFARTYQNRLDDETVDVKALGEELRGRLGFYIKRRLKQDVLDELPRKLTYVRAREMPSVQRDRYLLEVEQVRSAQGEGKAAGTAVLRALHAMRAISDHPYLPDRTLDAIDVGELVETSAKLQETVATLEDVRTRGDKAILFAERRETQRMLAQVLSERFGLHASIINGATPASRQGVRSAKRSRQQTIDHFEARPGFSAIIMSPLAAGVGLNVTAANHVIHYSRHWNPAKEDQATDRAYRIGQEKDVHVYYPMATLPEFKSFDVILSELLDRKRALAEASLFPTERVEVRPDELYEFVFSVPGGQTQRAPLGMQEVDTLDPQLFEAFVAALWKRQGYDVVLTPNGRDRGADVAAFSESGNVLLQVKQASRTVGSEAVQEITAARGFYERHFDTPFSMMVVTNAHVTTPAYELAVVNEVQVIERPALDELLGRFPVTLGQVREEEGRRLVNLD